MALTTTKQRKEIGERLRVERERLTYTTLQIAQLIGDTESVYITYATCDADHTILFMTRLYECGYAVQNSITV